jgi:hypothetical protein
MIWILLPAQMLLLLRQIDIFSFRCSRLLISPLGLLSSP